MVQVRFEVTLKACGPHTDLCHISAALILCEALNELWFSLSDFLNQDSCLSEPRRQIQ